MKKRKNLLFIMADQMRGIDMGCAGNNQVITPNLDKMANTGVQFQNAVSTFPVCTPQRAALVSGKYPVNTDVMTNDVPLPIDGKGFGYCLKEQGYTTGWIGKWHLFGPHEFRSSYIPEEHRHGFDYWAVQNCRHHYFDNFYYLNDNEKPVHFEGYEPDHQTELAIDYIEEHKKDPFALFLSFGPPHDPYDQVPERYRDLYDMESLEWRGNVKMPVETLKKWAVENPVPWWREEPDLPTLRDYYAAITALDDCVGRVLDYLEKGNLLEDTLVVFTSDHGEMMYSQGSVQKGECFEESINIPFLVAGGGVVKGESNTVPFGTVDIMPSIMGMLDLQISDYCEGDNLSHLLKGEDGENPEAALVMNAFPWTSPEWRGIRTERYTYARDITGKRFLFDNTIDILQQNNLAETRCGDAVIDALLTRMEKLLAEKMKRAKDRFEPWSSIEPRMETNRQAWREKWNFTP